MKDFKRINDYSNTVTYPLLQMFSLSLIQLLTPGSSLFLGAPCGEKLYDPRLVGQIFQKLRFLSVSGVFGDDLFIFDL